MAAGGRGGLRLVAPDAYSGVVVDICAGHVDIIREAPAFFFGRDSPPPYNFTGHITLDVIFRSGHFPLMAPALLLLRDRTPYSDGALAEVVIWEVPEPVPPCTHTIKYRLVYIVAGVRVLGMDNERGKGDHMHRHGTEMAYDWRGVEALLDDWDAMIAQERGE